MSSATIAAAASPIALPTISPGASTRSRWSTSCPRPQCSPTWTRTESALRKYHWLFLAQPAPFPETLIGAAPRYYLDHTLASWTATKDLSAYDPRALEHYRKAFEDPARIAASCEDYRAGASIDRLLDAADLEAGRKIEVPLLAIWGDAGLPSAGGSPLEVWRRYASDVRGVPIRSGHFVPEESPDACYDALADYLR